MVVIGRVEMRAVMRGERHPFDRPALAARQSRARDTRKEGEDLLGGVIVREVVDLRSESGRIGVVGILERA
jgi:hypothetical protein